MSSSHSALQSKATNPCMDKLRYIMLLAPFQPATRIELETNVNTSAECYLDIKNTGDKTLNVTITKVPAAERQIALSLSELEVQGKNNGTICIKWSPKETGCWRDVLQFMDNIRIKYDIVIATTAKDNKKSFHKTKRRLPKQSSSLLKPSNFSMSTTNKQFCQSNTLLKVPTIGPPLIPKLDVQAKQSKLRHENDLNKENIFNKFDETETYATRGRDDRISGTYHNHDKPDNVIFEQNMNVWNNESILPQVLFSTNEPQDIRRVTYVKEKKPYSSILHEHNEITGDTACDNDKIHSEISILLNKFTFTPAAVTSNSPELAESTSFSQSADKHTTFNISRSHLFETSATYDTKTFSNAPPISQPAGLQHLSPIKSDGCSLITDIKDLIASSPIAQHHNMPKNSNEYMKNLMVEPSIQITNREYFSFEIIPENIEASKKIGDMYIEISPPKKHFHSQIVSMSIPKLNSTRTGRITKNKTLYEGGSGKKLQLNLPVAKRSTKNVAAIKINKLSLSDLSKTKWHTSSFIRESRFGMQNKEHSFLYEALDPFAASTTEDPFLKNNSTVHYDEQWLLQQELAFTKWLNALLSSPEDLSVDIETAVTDIGKVWQSCKAQKNTVLAETKEAVSARFFSDPQLTKMPGYHKIYPSQKIVPKLNQFILKKFLYLIYFLDYAKQHKLIGHDPCLFHKRAQHKESREILLSFSRELLSGIGDVTRVLRNQDYILTHRQTYIEEYDYAVTDIRCDLRDGVRLCRVMELITGVRELTQRCRVPAISRLQKVYNVDLALNALRQAGYILEGDIDPKSIADGHCEKTLSLLWQIIHKYQAPRFDRAARVIQRWWRAKLCSPGTQKVSATSRDYRSSANTLASTCLGSYGSSAILDEEEGMRHSAILVANDQSEERVPTIQNLRVERTKKMACDKSRSSREKRVSADSSGHRIADTLESFGGEKTRKIEREELRRQWQEDIATKIRNECGEAMQMHLQDTTRLAIPDSDYWKEMIVNLRNCDNVGTLIACLNSLDIVTKLSPTVCIILCELNLADDIYNTIAQNNRSVPWMKVCLRACSILITLTKHNYTRKYILKNKYALVLMKLLNGSLKNKEIFLHCATLIWLLSQNEDYSKAMMACPQINWFIKNIQQKILKDDIVTKLQKLKDMEKLYPSCEPDRRNTQKPRLFTDMSIAIAAIVKKI
ncbi:protein abnormal spindle [Lasius niger]|uniref:Protein abnormal spindle n=1 Tax=Lasius niger TaxID=67767 RepID=A0A0J7L7T0_LASNI|nr:protein abnormal spindle [Lasius niger]